jgi:hypothetical protein
LKEKILRTAIEEIMKEKQQIQSRLKEYEIDCKMLKLIVLNAWTISGGWEERSTMKFRQT